MMNDLKLTDVVALNLQNFGIKNAFGVQGGAVVHIFDSLERLTDINVCYNHHEQASSLAAVSNSKIKNNIGVCIVTTGPATTNALTGLLSAWQDSIPVLFISGQTRKEQTSYGKNVRQRGSQECNILDVVKPWTKAQYFIDSDSDIDTVMKEALSIASQPRRGPVWIDIPVNLQWSKYEFKESLNEDNSKRVLVHNREVDPVINSLVAKLKSSQKPLFVLGRQAYSDKILNQFLGFLNANSIPVVTTWGSAGLVGSKANHIGIIGVSGQQAANFAIRASDLVIFVGCHFSATQAGNNYTKISQSQKFFYVNIDDAELSDLFVKNNHSKILSNTSYFLEKVCSFSEIKNEFFNKWKNFLSEVSDDLSPNNCVDKLDITGYSNPHKFIFELYSHLNSDDLVVVDGGGCALYAGFQCLPKKANFKVICSTAISAMGTGLPELVGVSTIGAHKRYFCIIGDGSLMFNLQELQTLKTNSPPCIIIVINNNGYLAIRHTQSQFLGSRYYGTSPFNNGLQIPEISDIAKTFNYEYLRLDETSDFNSILKQGLGHDQHTIIEIFASPSHSNLFSASFTDNKDGTFSPNDIHQMIPFDNYDYVSKALKHRVNLEK